MPDVEVLLVDLPPEVVAIEYKGKRYKGEEQRGMLVTLTLEQRSKVVCVRADGSKFPLAKLDACTGEQALKFEGGKVLF